MTLSSAKRGFTLIELLVVIAIIGILSSVVLASLGTARAKARDATRISDVKNVQLALELYYDSNQAYPPNSIAGGVNSFLVQGGAASPTLVAALVPTYIPVLPTDPQANTRADALEYNYVGTAAGAACATANCANSYGLGATLELEDNLVLDNDVDALSIAQFRSLGDASCQDATAGGNGTTEGCYSIQP